MKILCEKGMADFSETFMGEIMNCLEWYQYRLYLILNKNTSDIIIKNIKPWMVPSSTFSHPQLPFPCPSPAVSVTRFRRRGQPSAPYVRWFSYVGLLHLQILFSARRFQLYVFQLFLLVDRFPHSVHDSILIKYLLFRLDPLTLWVQL